LDSAILDGEVVAVDQNGIPRFELLQRFQQKPQGTLLYYVFDLPYLGGKDLTDLPLLRRRELLKKVLAENEVIRFSGAVEGEGKRFFELASQRGLDPTFCSHLFAASARPVFATMSSAFVVVVAR
jgi:bifunctional non-homologous end joining protein LigD